MKKIFIIEDDKSLNQELMKMLKLEGYEVETSFDFNQIIKRVFDSKPDLLLLDLTLPQMDGLEICKTLSKEGGFPIIVVTSRSTEIDELLSLKLGADDFITKPYHPHILLAHIESVLRRTNRGEEKLVYKEVTYYPLLFQLVYLNQTLELTANENKIISLLYKRKGEVVSREEMMEVLWQTDSFIDDNTLTVNINRLRHKLEGIGLSSFLETKRGIGYKI